MWWILFIIINLSLNLALSHTLVGVIPVNDAYGDVEGPAVGWVCNNGGVLAMVESPDAHPGDQRRTGTSITKGSIKEKLFSKYVVPVVEGGTVLGGVVAR